MRIEKASLIFWIAACAIVPLSAHDMWIEPSTFTPETKETVAIRLRVGQDLLGDPLPRDPSLIQEFIVEDATGRRPIAGRTGGNPAGFLRVSQPGMMVVGYRSNHSISEQPAAKFTQYLKDEGLESIVALRSRRNQTDVAVKELFSRCAKALILSGSADDAAGDRTLGFTLELVAGRNPYVGGASGPLPIQLLFQGKPLAGALVVAINRMNPQEKVIARTAKDGRVRLRLTGSEQMWLIKAVHMVEAPAGSGADWESFWASLTFEPPQTTKRISEVR
jgi:uncharacterized GH25 family protein